MMRGARRYVLESAWKPGWYIREGWFGRHSWTKDLGEATQWPEWNFDGPAKREAMSRFGGVAKAVEVAIQPVVE